ncbi:MAG: hypothetical protein FWE37_03390 [Spirochaetaceae bacterium]|nr:hypothetical protein [Spirochaetaceae bacterium]
MGEKDAKIWRKLEEALAPTASERELGLKLFKEYNNNGYLKYSITYMQQLPNAVLFNFYHRLALLTTPGRPFYRKQSNDWLKERNLLTINLNEVAGWVGLLRVAPLVKNTAFIINHFLKEDDVGIVSHVKFNPLGINPIADDHLSGNHFISLVLEALFRLKIGILFELPLLVSPQARAIPKRADIFCSSPYGFLFNLNSSNEQYLSSCDYLTKVSSYWQERYNIDGLFLNFNHWPSPVSKEVTAHLITKLNTRPSFGLIGFNLDKTSKDYMAAEEMLNLNIMPEPSRAFWRYLSNNLSLFTYRENLTINDNELHYSSLLLDKTIFKKLEPLNKITTDSFNLIISKDKNFVYIILFNFTDLSEDELDISGYITKAYRLESDFFYNGSYHCNEPQLKKAGTAVTLVAMPAYSVAIYKLIINN